MPKEDTDSKKKLRFRDIFGYLFFFGLLLFLVLFYFTEIPFGLSASEMASATISGNLTAASWLPSQVVDLPYHAIQWLSFNVFDISIFSIKLPSIIMAILTGTMILFIVRELYNTRIAILTGLITVSSLLFLVVARTGDPMIMPVFLSVVAMFAVSRALHKSDHTLRWMVLAGVALALNLYSPMGIYLTIIAIIAAAFHPNVRLILFKTKSWKIIVATLILLITITPLVTGIIRDPSVGLQLLGTNDFNLSIESIKNNFFAIFWPVGGEHVGIAAPILTLSTIGFVIIGLVGAIRNFHSVRSYLAIPLFGVILVLTLFNISAAPLLIIPTMLLIAIGINYLLEWWFGLFPRNPYAKAVGIIPLAVLFGWMILSGSVRYFEVNFYDKNIVYDYYSGFDFVKKAASETEKKVLIVTKNTVEKDFYTVVFHGQENVTVNGGHQSGSEKIILLQSAFDEVTNRKPNQIITNGLRHNSEIIRVFE